MRLVEIVAEWQYLKDTNGTPYVPFTEQDSNVRDFYFRSAREVLPSLIAGYLRRNGDIAKRVRGSVKSFIDAHEELTKENREGLVKRILSSIQY